MCGLCDTLKKYREETIIGECIDLVPSAIGDSAKIVELRNKEKNMYMLNQTQLLTIESQENWFVDYLNRDNDIYWCIYNKMHDFIGTIRMYNINQDESICDQGSFIIDENFSSEAPYALEAEILSLDFIFYKLGIQSVVNEDRCDNKVMNNLSKKLGFELKNKKIINGVKYNYYVLSISNYKKHREKFFNIIEYWGNR